MTRKSEKLRDIREDYPKDRIVVGRVSEVQAPRAVPEAAPPPPAQPVYKFWNKSKCPRCGVMDTEAYATNGPVQSRICRVPTCRHKYRVTGEIVK